MGIAHNIIIRTTHQASPDAARHNAILGEAWCELLTLLLALSEWTSRRPWAARQGGCSRIVAMFAGVGPRKGRQARHLQERRMLASPF